MRLLLLSFGSVAFKVDLIEKWSFSQTCCVGPPLSEVAHNGDDPTVLFPFLKCTPIISSTLKSCFCVNTFLTSVS